jgi:hypothetical protein
MLAFSVKATVIFIEYSVSVLAVPGTNNKTAAKFTPGGIQILYTMALIEFASRSLLTKLHL